MAISSVEVTQRSHKMQSIGAVLAGILAGVIPSLATDMAMSAIGVLPHLGQPAGDAPLLLATAYRTVYGVAGSYITARLAPNRPMGHALVLGVLGFVVSIAGAVATWNRQPSLGPHWYPVALVLLAIPTAFVGGKLRVTQLRSSQAAHQA
jgi:hypothetical protein